MTRPKPTTAEITAAVRLVVGAHRPGSVIRGVDRTKAVMASSYPAEVVTVTFDDGQRLELFLKDLSSRMYDADLPQRRSREIAVYRDLLDGAGLGTPRYYRSAQDSQRNIHWLLLEYVDGDCLRHLPFEQWIHAAGWLGRLQAHVARHPRLLACRELQPVTLDDYLTTAAAAVRAAAAYGRGCRARLVRALAGYRQLARLMAAQPRTLAHGSYRPQNILIGRAPDPDPPGGTAPRVCALDWETATLAPAGYDVAYLADGFDDDRRQMLTAAYRAEAARGGLQVPEGPQADRLHFGYDLHKNLKTLGKASDRRFPPDGVEKLVAMIEVAAARALQTGSPSVGSVA